MNISNLINELELEASVTRKFLELVPWDQLDFKPSEKAQPLSFLAQHLVNAMSWWKGSLLLDRLDVTAYKNEAAETKDALLEKFDAFLAEGMKALRSISEEELEKEWSLCAGEQVYFSMKKKQVWRTFCMNHIIHHRAQLGIYFRILGVAVPASYGPSADDPNSLLMQVWT